MSYVITKTDGSILTTTNMPNGTLIDGTTDSSTGLTLIGRNFPSYGQPQNTNFIRLLENFADTVPPTQSLSALTTLTGTIWYDTGSKKIKVYDGANWNLVGGSIVSNTAPTALTYTLATGDQWWDTVNQRLNVWNGTEWSVMGLNANISQLRADTGTYMTANVAILNANISQLQSATASNVSTLNSTISQLRADTGTYMTANVATLNSTISQLRADTGNYMTANINSINNNLTANYASKSYVTTAFESSPSFNNPVFTGIITTEGKIIPNANVNIDLGDGLHWFNNIYGRVIQAQYADLAEKYIPDAEYEVGTVVSIGGTAEITASSLGERAIGAISANPAYVMNAELAGGVYVALKGRVPVKVIGAVNKGDKLIANNNGVASVTNESADIFAIAIETSTDTGVKLVEAVIL